MLAEAKTLFDAGDLAGATDLYGALLQADPENAPALAGIAECMIAVGQPDNARQALANLPEALAADPAETFVATNIQAGFDILNDKTLPAEARRAKFATFLEGLTDIRRVALFLIGSAAATAA